MAVTISSAFGRAVYKLQNQETAVEETKLCPVSERDELRLALSELSVRHAKTEAELTDAYNAQVIYAGLGVVAGAVLLIAVMAFLSFIR